MVVLVNQKFKSERGKDSDLHPPLFQPLVVALISTSSINCLSDWVSAILNSHYHMC